MQKSSNLGAEIARDAICTCKSCNHEIAMDCMKAGCTCCKKINHSMILDGIEGFASLKSKRRSSSSDDINEKRPENLLILMKLKGYLTDRIVEEAMRKVPRHLFVSSDFAKHAYEDRPLPTKNGQTISQPSVVARMTEWLDVREGNKVLEIGCGSGWQSAILSVLVGEGKVCSIERFSDLIEFARQNHKNAGIKNVEVIEGDGSLGLAGKSPFDRIIVTAACPEAPKPLLEQLSLDGLLVAPIGKGIQSMVLLKKTTEGIKEIRREAGYIFAPLIGKFGFKRPIESLIP